MEMRDEHTSFGADVAKGVVAGAAGTWAMERVTGYFWEHQAEEARQRCEEVTGGRYPPARMAERADDLLHLGLYRAA